MIFTLVYSLTIAQTQPASYRLSSPNQQHEAIISLIPTLSWSILSGGQTLLAPSQIGLVLEGGEVLGAHLQIISADQSSCASTIPAPLYKKAMVKAEYNQLKLTCKGDWGLIFRVYNEGVSYRFFTARQGNLTVTDEIAQFNFPADHSALLAYTSPRADNRFAASYQSLYTAVALSESDPDKTVILPALVTVSESTHRRVVITEADLEHYPGMFLQKAAQGYGFTALFPPYPKTVSYHPTRKQERVTGEESFIAKTSGTREFPWRVIALSDQDASLLTSDLIYALAPDPDPTLYPIAPANTPHTAPQIPWIKPGKVAWDWWNDWRIYGVDFVAGINTQTYQYYIDFAADNGLEYVILDEGWSPPPTGDVMKIIPEIDLPKLIRYADSKNVGLILWVVWNVLDQKLEEACAHYAQMGIKGFKIDFIDRADQKAIEFVPRACLMAAKYKLIVDFHGVSKPTGQPRTYPNALNFEGVYGLEELKWSNPDMPFYDVTWPFIRGFAGPADYTQGAMKNAAKDVFANIYNEPMSQGTRCHQIGSYMIFDSPLSMLCDNPSNYKKEQECTDFIAQIPTTFDETVVVAAAVGEYIVMARRKGNDWYIGGMTNWTPRDLELDLSFLPV
ncbi:MAG: glycoside hydrolase family 97 protein, partial [Bacteroidetes bacterium]|nr:glycoside hydrolase family 97 protein [Bacteroidota bacterium]